MERYKNVRYGDGTKEEARKKEGGAPLKIRSQNPKLLPWFAPVPERGGRDLFCPKDAALFCLVLVVQ